MGFNRSVAGYFLIWVLRVLTYFGICIVGSEVDPSTENELQLTTKRKKNKKQAEPEIDFTEALEKEMLDIFAPPKNPKSLILPASRAPCNTKLPEDCHYQPEDLVKLFLLPCIKVCFLSIYEVFVF